MHPKPKEHQKTHQMSDNKVMKLPPEIVYEILSYQFRDLMSSDHPANAERFQSNLRTFLKSNLEVNKTFRHVVTVLCYRYCNFTTARGFYKLLETLKTSDKGYSKLIQIADFQELTSIGLGRTGEMNKMIKNLTNETIWEFVRLTRSNLREFLASEHIQMDLDDMIIHALLSPTTGSVLSVVDFCGCSGSKFTQMFIQAVEKLYNGNEIIDYNYQITCLGLNDCTDLPSYILGKLLNTLPELQKLDLRHTSLDDQTLIRGIPHLKGLTHLSLGMCSQLTPRTVLEFFSYHPAVTDENNSTTLQWLNIQVHPHSSSWTDVQAMFLLKKLCRYGHNKTLQYLNIGGIPLHESDDATITKTNYYYQCQDTLQFIKWNFPNLKSLSIRDNNIPYPKLVHFLSPVDIEDVGSTLGENVPLPQQKLKFLDIANNSHINKWSIQDTTLFTCSPTLVAIELSFDPWQQIESTNFSHTIACVRHLTRKKSIIQDFSNTEIVNWKCYIDSSYGRRYWVYKVDPVLNRGDLETVGSLTRYDSQGHKIIDIVKQPDFLKFAQSKIMLGCGIVPMSAIRRKISYRDVKPPISQFFNRKGGPTMGSRTLPVRIPRLPPGGWRIIHNVGNEDITNTDHEVNSTPSSAHSAISVSSSVGNDQASVFHNTRDGLYWDRSISDLYSHMMQEEETETDDGYLHDPELQRRRSQLSLFRASHSSSQKQLHIPSIASMSNIKKQHQSHVPDLSDFVYDPNDQETTELYRIHFEIVKEYEVFGCIERGMYRYYSLRT